MAEGGRAPKPRVRALDALRGFSVASMTAYHALYDLVYLYGVRAPGYRGLPGYLWQQSICWVFILVAGASLHYSRRVLRRGLAVCGCALVLTAVTFLAMPGMGIAFGVLHMLGAGMLLAAALRGALGKIPPLAGLLVCAGLFILTRGVPMGFIGVLDWPLLALPRRLYGTGFLFWLGLPGPAFVSSDYFPLVPWVFLFFAGYYLWAMAKGRVPAAPLGKNPLEWMGRHSLMIYMAHQPVLLGLLGAARAAGLLG